MDTTFLFYLNEKYKTFLNISICSVIEIIDTFNNIVDFIFD